MSTKNELLGKKSAFGGQNSFSNGVKKLLRFLKARSQGILYAAPFFPLAPVSESRKLSGLYNSGDLSTYLNTIFKVAISVGAILAVLRLGYAGYLYMGGDTWGNKSRAREMIRDVFLGLFLLLSVWIILYQINPNILKLDIAMEPIPSAPVTAPATSAVTAARQARLNAILADERLRRASIQSTNFRIFINNSGVWCTSLTQLSGCTNVGLLPQIVINKLDILQRACNCDVTITSGTEFWMHDTHGPGIPIVDLRSSTGLNNYLLGTGATPTSGARITKDGAQYIYETTGDNGTATGNHWHVRF